MPILRRFLRKNARENESMSTQCESYSEICIDAKLDLSNYVVHS